MFFDCEIAVAHGVTGVDPVTDPGGVTAAETGMLARRATGCDVTGRRLLVALDAGAGETVTVSLYALDERTWKPDVEAPDPEARRFYAVATGQVITRGVLSEITAKVPPGGAVYVRVTADAMAAGGVLRLACVP